MRTTEEKEKARWTPHAKCQEVSDDQCQWAGDCLECAVNYGLRSVSSPKGDAVSTDDHGCGNDCGGCGDGGSTKKSRCLRCGMYLATARAGATPHENCGNVMEEACQSFPDCAACAKEFGPVDDDGGFLVQPGFAGALGEALFGDGDAMDRAISDLDKEEVSYPRLGAEIGILVEEKQAAYGDSFGRSGSVMRILYPDGVSPDHLEDSLVVVRILDKLFRVATNRDALGESPWRDIAGYAILAAKRAEGGK